MYRVCRRGRTIGALTAILAACAPGASPPGPVPTAGAEACLVAADPNVLPLTDVRVVVPEPIGLELVAAASIAERFVQGLLFTPLVRIDCRGHVIPLGREGRRGVEDESGGYRILHASERGGLYSNLALTPVVAGSGPRLSIEVAPGGLDARDLLDRPMSGGGRADILFSRDPATLAYARGRADFIVAPLPWDRTYVAIGRSPSLAIEPSAESRGALARDAVRGDARGAMAPFWWDGVASCLPAPVPGSAGPSTGQVVYPEGDPIARGLAERLVALGLAADRPPWISGVFAATGPGRGLRAVGLAPTPLASAIGMGRIAAAVVPYPRLEPAGCGGLVRAPGGFAAVALVDSRAHVIARRGVPAFAIDGDGTIRFLRSDPR